MGGRGPRFKSGRPDRDRRRLLRHATIGFCVDNPLPERGPGDALTENVEIVRRSLEAFRDGDVEEALALGHPEMISARVDLDGAVFYGRQGVLRLMADWTEGFEEWSYRPEEYVDAGGHVVVRIRQWGRGAESGVPVESDNWLVYDVEDGLITRVEIHTERDRAFAAAGLPT